MRSSTNGWGNREICPATPCCPIETHGSCCCASSLSASVERSPHCRCPTWKPLKCSPSCNTWRMTGKYPSAPATVGWLPSTASSPLSHVASQLAITQCSEIARIPVKKMNRPAMDYLDAEEITAILRQPDRSNPQGQRDHALLGFLYNTGARIQEALNVCPQAIRFESPAHVELLGKGRKSRVCPLWPETVDLLKALLRRRPRPDDQPIFVNCYGRPLGAAGVRFKLKHYVQAAAQEAPSLAKKRVGPHTFRHSVGVQLVAAGVDTTVIRNWFGHARLDTTDL